MADTAPGATRRTNPTVSSSDPRFKWHAGADVQATWHRLTGWTPPSAGRTEFFEEPVKQPAHVTKLRRAK